LKQKDTAITYHCSKKWTKFVLIALVSLLLVFIYWQYNPTSLFVTLKHYHLRLLMLTQKYPIFSRVFYCLCYIIITTLALPGAALLTIAGGSLFGLRDGILLTLCTATVGATLVCILVRTYGKQFIKSHYPQELRTLNSIFQHGGSLYLLTLRLIPVIPFFLVNVLCGVTSLPLNQFIVLSFIGMLPGVILYTYAGTILASLDSLRDLISPRILITFFVLAAIPYLVAHITQSYKPYKNRRESV
jgi:uncharacterized membrane protein YdjX (TVP38/TMEM64 family)